VWDSRVVGWRLQRVSYLLKVLNQIAGKVSGRVLLRRKCIWARWVYCIKVRGGIPASVSKAV